MSFIYVTKFIMQQYFGFNPLKNEFKIRNNENGMLGIVYKVLNTIFFYHCSVFNYFIFCFTQALRLSHSVFSEITVGHVVNLLSNDVNRFDISVIYIHQLWIGPLQMIIVLYFLWRETGMSSLIGMSSFLIFIPLQSSFQNNEIKKIIIKFN